MTFTEKMDVLGVLIDLITDHLKKLDKGLTEVEKVLKIK